MKKVLALLVVVVLAVSFFGTTACRKPATDPEPTPFPTAFTAPSGASASVFDDMEDNNSQSNSVTWGGYWYTYDDLTSKEAATDYGTSPVWPMSADADARWNYGLTPVPTFQMSVPSVDGSNFAARMTGTVIYGGLAASYPYGFIAMACDLKDGGAGPKIPVDLITQGFTGVYFVAKRGPLDTTALAYKIKFNSTSHADADLYFKAFSPTSTWQQYTVLFSTCAQEGWGAAVVRDTAFDHVTAIQFQTHGGASTQRPVDLYVDDIVLIK